MTRLSRKKASALALLLAAAAGLLYYAFFTLRIDTVIEGRFYRSAQLSGPALERLIRGKGLRTVINLRGNDQDSGWFLEEQEVVRQHGVNLYTFDLSANKLPVYLKLRRIIELLASAEKPVLIHCKRGADRTGLVSALALALEKDPPLNELKNQFSVWYGVLPFYRSAGPYFFSRYEQWLHRNKKSHSRETLLGWIENDYHDDQGNIEYWIDHVNGRAYFGPRVTIPENTRRIVIEGWAFDARRNVPAEELFLVVDGRIEHRVSYIRNRPDVAEVFSLGNPHRERFVVGWRVEMERGDLADGCHRLSLRLVQGPSLSWDIRTENYFCLDGPPA